MVSRADGNQTMVCVATLVIDRGNSEKFNKHF